MIRSGGWAVRQVARRKVWMESYGGSQTPAVKSTLQVRVNGDLSEAFPRGVGHVDPYLRCCSISCIDDPVAGLYDTCSEYGICIRLM
jgi:hypothetical protein